MKRLEKDISYYYEYSALERKYLVLIKEFSVENHDKLKNYLFHKDDNFRTGKEKLLELKDTHEQMQNKVLQFENKIRKTAYELYGNIVLNFSIKEIELYHLKNRDNLSLI